MHIPVVGQKCKLGGLEFEVKEVTQSFFRTERCGFAGYWTNEDGVYFAWPKPEAVWTEEHAEELKDFVKNIPGCPTWKDAMKMFINFVRSRIK